MICDEHGELECSICFSSNPDWKSSKPYVPGEGQFAGKVKWIFGLTPRVLRMAIQHIKASRGVENARRRNQKEETHG